jgi:hypothetical protein
MGIDCENGPVRGCGRESDWRIGDFQWRRKRQRLRCHAAQKVDAVKLAPSTRIADFARRSETKRQRQTFFHLGVNGTATRTY